MLGRIPCGKPVPIRGQIEDKLFRKMLRVDAQEGGPNVILSWHDLRERHAYRRQGNADHRLRGETGWRGSVSRGGADSPSAGLERVLHRDDAPVRAPRLPGDLRQPL